MTPVILPPTILQSTCIYCIKQPITDASVTMYWSGGDAQFYLGLSNSPNTSPTTWEQVTGIASGVETTHTFTDSGTALYYQVLKDSTTIIETQLNSGGEKTAPAIRIRNIVTT